MLYLQSARAKAGCYRKEFDEFKASPPGFLYRWANLVTRVNELGSGVSGTSGLGAYVAGAGAQ